MWFQGCVVKCKKADCKTMGNNHKPNKNHKQHLYFLWVCILMCRKTVAKGRYTDKRFPLLMGEGSGEVKSRMKMVFK